MQSEKPEGRLLDACGNEWVRRICEKPRVRCAECTHRRLLPLTDEVIRWHLSGQDPSGTPFVMGADTMLVDETCFFPAVDFDGKAWVDDATMFRQACRTLNLPVDASWKHGYAASVRRLIHDGVDATPGRLFVGATDPPSAEAEEGRDAARERLSGPAISGPGPEP